MFWSFCLMIFMSRWRSSRCLKAVSKVSSLFLLLRSGMISAAPVTTPTSDVMRCRSTPERHCSQVTRYTTGGQQKRGFQGMRRFKSSFLALEAEGDERVSPRVHSVAVLQLWIVDYWSQIINNLLNLYLIIMRLKLTRIKMFAPSKSFSHVTLWMLRTPLVMNGIFLEINHLIIDYFLSWLMKHFVHLFVLIYDNEKASNPHIWPVGAGLIC